MEQGSSQCNVHSVRKSQAPYKIINVSKHGIKSAFVYLVDLNQKRPDEGNGGVIGDNGGKWGAMGGNGGKGGKWGGMWGGRGGGGKW